MTTRKTNNPQVKLRKSIGFRYPLIVGTFLLVAQLLFGAYQAYINYQQALADLRNKSELQADFLSSVTPETILRSDFITLESLMRQTSQDPDSVFAVVINRDGRPLTRFVNQNSPIIAQALNNSAESDILSLVRVLKQDPSVIEIRAPITLQDAPLGEIWLGYTLSNARQRALNSAAITLFTSILVAAFLAGLTTILLNRQVINPLRALADLASSLAIRDFRRRADVSREDEISALGASFNSMADQLDEILNSLEQRVADRTKALAASTEVSRRLSTFMNQRQLMIEVVEQVKSAFNYYHAQIYLFDAAKEELIMAGGTGEVGAVLLGTGHKIAKGKGLVGRAAGTNAPVLIADTTKDPDWLPNPLLPETSSEAAIPISIGDEVVGVLDVQHNIADGLKQEDVELLQSIANQVAIAMQNIRSAEIVAKRATELQTVATISTAAATIQNIQKMLETVVHLTQRGFGLYHAHVFTYDDTVEELQIVACGYKEGDVHEGTHGTTSIPIAQEQSLVARAARTRQAIIVNDVHDEPGWLPNPLLPDTASELAVPLIVGDQLLGVLDVQSDRLNAFSEEDASIQTTLASQVATALQNARSFAQAQHQAEHETMVNAISQKIQSATTIETALQTAARELGHALGRKPTLVVLDPPAQPSGRKGN